MWRLLARTSECTIWQPQYPREEAADLFKSSWPATQYIFFNSLNKKKSWTLSRATCYNQISIL